MRAALVTVKALANQAKAAADRAEATAVKAQLSGDAALSAHLWLEIASLNRTFCGQRSEHKQRLIDQYKLQFEELEASTAADALVAEKAGRQGRGGGASGVSEAVAQPFPAHLPRVRVVVAGPAACPYWRGTCLSKMNEVVTETLDAVPRR